MKVIFVHQLSLATPLGGHILEKLLYIYVNCTYQKNTKTTKISETGRDKKIYIIFYYFDYHLVPQAQIRSKLSFRLVQDTHTVYTGKIFTIIVPWYYHTYLFVIVRGHLHA